MVSRVPLCLLLLRNLGLRDFSEYEISYTSPQFSPIKQDFVSLRDTGTYKVRPSTDNQQ